MIPIALWGEAWPGIRSHFGPGLARPTACTRASCHGRPPAALRCREAPAGLPPPPTPPPACCERQPMPACWSPARCRRECACYPLSSASLAEHTSSRGVASLRCPLRATCCERSRTRSPTAAALCWHGLLSFAGLQSLPQADTCGEAEPFSSAWHCAAQLMATSHHYEAFSFVYKTLVCLLSHRSWPK